MTIEEAFQSASDYYQKGHFQQAEHICREILEKIPTNAEALYFLGIIYVQLGQHDSAIYYIQKSLRINPTNADAYLALGTAFQQKGLFDDAVSCYQRTINLDPTNADSYNLLGDIFKNKGQLEDAIASYQKAVQLNPDFCTAHCNLGSLLLRKEKADEAIAHFQKALNLNPDLVDAYNKLGCAVKEKGQLDKAVSYYRKAIQLDPHHPELYNNLGMTYQAKGWIDEAESWFRRAIQIRGDCSFYSNFLFNMLYNDRYSADAIYTAHRGAETVCTECCVSSPAPHSNDRDPSRKLKIGYVSPDFMNHSVNFFIEPVLIAHRRDQFEVFCYSNVSLQDQVTQRIKGYAIQWKDIAGMPDEEAEELIRKDKIDILVDLAGHTAHNRLPLFARKPAPVQVNWIGYPATTGLSTIDYKIGDKYTDPPGTTEQFYSEKLMRLPESFLCYLPQQDSPDIEPLPLLKNGYITFGSFNNFAKVTSGVYTVWAKILNAVTGSRLIMKWQSFCDRATVQYVKSMFRQRGIDEERIILETWDPSPEYLYAYNKVDIGLDTFPFNGITTTCQALWMGVPVITLVGEAYASRGGVSLLSNVGIPDFIAYSKEEYLELAVNLAHDPRKLGNLRQCLRDKMAHSPLLDREQFILHLEESYHQMWKNWAETH